MGNVTLQIMGSIAQHFTIIPNEFVRDPEVTPRAARLYMYLVSHENGWKLSIAATMNATGMGRDQVFSALKDLRRMGYVKRYQVVNDGKFAGTTYQVFVDRLPEDERDDLGGNGERVEQAELEGAGAVDDRIRKTRIRENRIRKTTTLKNTNTKKTNLQEDNPPVVPPRGDAPAPAKAEPANPSKEIEPSEKSKPAKRTDRGSRLEDGWMPSQKVIDQMRQECPHVNLEYEHRKFTDYWLSVPASRGRKSNWDATWRNWIRRASESRTGGNTPPQETFDYYADMLIQEHRAQQAATGGQTTGQTQGELPQ